VKNTLIAGSVASRQEGGLVEKHARYERVEKKAQRTDFKEAVVSVYSRLAESLMDNQPYF
jgi:hypothetical protein